jgi:hypothetical protein
MKKIWIGASVLALAVGAMPAAAAPLLFELSGSRSATFILDPEKTAPDYFSSSFIGDQVSYNSVQGTFGGMSGSAFVGFGTYLAATLNIQSPNLGFTQFAGPDLFTVSNMRPVFKPGTYQLTSIVSGSSSLKISAAGVPEPASWAMLLAGFGLMGAAIRYRRHTLSAVTA